MLLQGSYVYDVMGRKYLDSLAGLWCTALGTLQFPSKPRDCFFATDFFVK